MFEKYKIFEALRAMITNMNQGLSNPRLDHSSKEEFKQVRNSLATILACIDCEYKTHYPSQSNDVVKWSVNKCLDQLRADPAKSENEADTMLSINFAASIRCAYQLYLTSCTEKVVN